MKLYVIRHAFAGDKSDDPRKERERGLTNVGVEMANAAAQAMIDADETPKVIFCSPFERTVETADILGKAFGVSVNIIGDLAPDRPLETEILSLLGHDRLKRIGIVVHSDNTGPAFDKFGGTMLDCARKGDDKITEDSGYWPMLKMAEARRLNIHREFGYWECAWRWCPSDSGLEDIL